MPSDPSAMWLPGVEWTGAARAAEPADAAERRRALDPAVSFIVQAPAGSGKTELLIQRFLTLLARVDQPEAVVAITFTVKAAGEMRARVLDALSKVQAGAEPSSAHERFTLELAAGVLERDRRSAWNLLHHPGRLRIQTIDALCMGITRQMPWLARFGAMPRVTEDARPMYLAAAAGVIERLGSQDEVSEAAACLVRHLENDAAAAIALLARMLETRDQWLRLIGANADPLAVREPLERALENVICHELERLRDALPPAEAAELVQHARYAGGNLREGGLTCLASLNDLPGCGVDDLPQWIALSKLLLTGAGDWRKKPDRRVGFPPSNQGAKSRFESQLQRLAGYSDFRDLLRSVPDLPAGRYEESQWEVLTALFRLLPVTVAHLRAVFIERGEVDFVEIAEAALRALGNPGQPTDLALTLGARIEHLLVDEFQDTSVTQFELLKMLTAGWDDSSPRTLFLVGDPMQSIYRFRQAEVGIFLDVRQSGVGPLRLEPLRLSVNFRSARPVVDWVNGTFASVFPSRADPYSGAVPYTPSTAFREGDADAGVMVHPMIGRNDRQEAELILDLLERGVSTAILVRSRAHLPAIAALLRDNAIPYRAIEVQSMAERPVVQDLLALTRALLHLGDRPAWLAVLRAPWCGLTLAGLHAVAAPNLKCAIWDAIRRPDLSLSGDDSARLARIVSPLSQALDRRGRVSVAQLVERTWAELGGPALVDEYERSDARAFFELLEAAGQDGDIGDFTLLMQRVSDLFANPESGVECSLELMTIHKAKGLEFDTVILPGLGKRARSDDPELLLWSERAVGGSSELLMAPISRAGADEDRTYRFIRHEESAKDDHESLRLLYVACTRAKRRLHLIGHIEPEAGDPASDSMLAHLWDTVQPDFDVELANYDWEPVLTRTPREPRVLRRVAVVEEPGESPILPGIAARPAAPESPRREAARAAGTLIHRILHRIAEDGLERWPADRIPSLQDVLDDEVSWPHVEQSLRTTLSDERGRWILSPHSEARSEFGVSGMVDGVLQHLVIDRTFVDDSGTRWIIDFKTAADEPDYRLQLEAYARVLAVIDPRPVRVGLYFTATAEWIEWRPLT